MPKRLETWERRAIISALLEGRQARDIAIRHGRHLQTVEQHARKLRLMFGKDIVPPHNGHAPPGPNGEP